MRSNSYWYVFLGLIGIIVLGYSGFTLMKIKDYVSLSQSADPLSIHWSFSQRAEDNYVLQVHYEFEWHGQRYQGNMDEVDHHLNRWSLQEAIDRANKRRFTVWFNPYYPEKSTLFKNFPLKNSIYSAILWLVLFYFVWLGYSMNRYKT